MEKFKRILQEVNGDVKLALEIRCPLRKDFQQLVATITTKDEALNFFKFLRDNAAYIISGKLIKIALQRAICLADSLETVLKIYQLCDNYTFFDLENELSKKAKQFLTDYSSTLYLLKSAKGTTYGFKPRADLMKLKYSTIRIMLLERLAELAGNFNQGWSVCNLAMEEIEKINNSFGIIEVLNPEWEVPANEFRVVLVLAIERTIRLIENIEQGIILFNFIEKEEAIIKHKCYRGGAYEDYRRLRELLWDKIENLAINFDSIERLLKALPPLSEVELKKIFEKAIELAKTRDELTLLYNYCDNYYVSDIWMTKIKKRAIAKLARLIS